jgi:hypothetical protein
MKTQTIVIGCLALLLLGGVIAACAVGGIFMLGLGGYADETEKNGIEFGKHTDQLGCQTEALRRLRAANKALDPFKKSGNELFLYGCFQTSRATTDFCAKAPKEDAFFTIRRWSQEQCQKEGMGNDEACLDLFSTVTDDCLGKIKHQRR